MGATTRNADADKSTIRRYVTGGEHRRRSVEVTGQFRETEAP